jgi:spore germination protein GerM
MAELIAGPEEGSALLATIPGGTFLRDINVREDGVAVVDFSRGLISGHPGGSLGEMLTVYSIVNTLTQFPRVQSVQFLVEGRQVDTLAGHFSLVEPLSRDTSLIKP